MRLHRAGDEIVGTARELAALGLVKGTWGNISCRLSEESFALTPSGVEYDALKPEDIVEVGLDLSFKGAKKPSIEAPMHAEVYKNREDTGAAVHTHPTFASAFAIAGHSLPPVLEDVAQVVGGRVECAPYARAGTEKLAQKAVKALGDKSAAFLANHGLLAVGESLGEVLNVTLVVESACESFLFARLLGEVKPLAEEEVVMLRKFYLEEYRRGER